MSFVSGNEDVSAAMINAGNIASESGAEYVQTVHLLLGMLNAPAGEFHRILETLGLSISGLRTEVEAQMLRSETSCATADSAPQAKPAIELAMAEASKDKLASFGLKHLLIGMLLMPDDPVAKLLFKHRVTVESVRCQLRRSAE